MRARSRCATASSDASTRPYLDKTYSNKSLSLTVIAA